MSKPKNYQVAIEELETIVSALEEGDLPIDDLSQRVKRASELISFCRSKLLLTEKEVQSVLDDLRGKVQSNG
ncbi:MAG: exodeoxyribonuclease VII small subunit [Schleiferiaceae bacterium]|nr:exodeoxyribonuclease VII small subunit [Schleiferiaceae bacterium]